MQLSRQQPGGGSLREHLQVVAATTGHADPRLMERPPAESSALWNAYCDLSAMRPSGMGASCIPGIEYESWQRLSGVQFTAWEVDTLKAMDRAALAAMADAAPRPPQKGTR